MRLLFLRIHSLFEIEKYDISKIQVSPKISNTLVTLVAKGVEEWTFDEVSQLFHTHIVTLRHGIISVNPKPKPMKQLKTKLTKCAECDIVVPLHERRGRRSRFCKRCWLKQIIDCKFCHRKTEREHRCVQLPFEKIINKKKYRLCTECPASGEYFAINAFKRHVQRKHIQYLFQCSKCPNRFSCKGDLNNHMKNHSNELTYKCQHCDKKFRWQSERSVHMKTHPVNRNKAHTVDHSIPKPQVFAVGVNALLNFK